MIWRVLFVVILVAVSLWIDHRDNLRIQKENSNDEL